MFKMIYNIARTELAMLFYSPVAWLILVVFGLQAGISFSNEIDKLVEASILGNRISSSTLAVFANQLKGVLGVMEQYLYFYIPLLTMSLVSKELSSGSIKLLYSSPITNTQIILGKFLSIMIYGLIMMAILLLLTLCGGMVLDNMDWSMVLVGILGLYLLLCAYAAIGIFMSSLTSYQIVAAIGTFATLMVLSMIGKWWQEYDIVRDITYWLSISGRSGKFISGMICSEDVLYFIIVIALFLTLTIIRLNAVRQKIPFPVTFAKNLGVIALVCMLGYATSRPQLKVYYDTTDTKMNTLTPNSQEIIKQLKGKVTLTTYINALEPGAPMYTRYYFLKPDMQRFEQYLRFKPDMELKYVYYYDKTYNPKLDSRHPNATLREKMLALCEMNKLDSSKFLTPEEIHKQVDLSGENNTFVRQIVCENGQKTWLRIYNDMMRFPSEKEISAAFKGLVMDLPQVGFVSGEGERSITGYKDRDYSAFARDKKFRHALQNQGFDVHIVTLDKPVSDSISTLVIADMKEWFGEKEEANLQQYIDRGGNLFILGEPKHRDIMNPLFAKFGYRMTEGQLVRKDPNLVPNVIISFPTEESAQIAYDFEYMKRFGSGISTPSCAGLEKTEDKGYKTIDLFRTRRQGGVWNELHTTDFIDDTIQYNPEKGEIEKVYSTVVALSRNINGKEQKIILSGDADCISNSEFGRRSAYKLSNFSLITGSFLWFSDNEVPIDIRRPLPQDNSISIGTTGGSAIKWIFTLILPLLLAVAGIFVWIRRKGR